MNYELGGRPARVSRIEIVVTPPAALPAGRRDAFLAVASHCTVHYTLVQPPAIDVMLTADTVPAIGG